jgi:hypothetical protein
MEKVMMCRACSTQKIDFKWILHFLLEIQRGRAHFRNHTWQDNYKIALQEIGCKDVGWLYLT